MVEKRTIKTVVEIIEYITEVAKEKNITISSLEDSAYISQGLISRWRKGNGNVSPSMLNLISIFDSLGIEMTLELKDDTSKLKDDKSNEKCPKFLDHVDVIFDSELLEQKIKEKLNYELEGDTAKLLKEVLFSDNITLEDKKKIHKMLEILIVTEEMKEM